ncbi:GntR family histidine utilization transcriptional repressor [Pararhizobium capsulatum DSM 1112]|uniref:Histidine utilization repressor n=1 Tax=Pararhizobium capsulatum DSM 1112 TaxID=1121113 RepID=A0ABU0BWV9_9HYPH|nr:histidine utilization repressor [Pararhizobium capsulatum]MDQ0322750.1 GntR family histidine utilization transcriptional repressor [Pararhizobium capsulatum DSM 1112]
MDLGTTVAEGASDLSLHQRILGDIEERILSGEWQPGFRIPFEVDLAEHYKCSRMTVNKALTQLAKTGLIERRRKSGSYVTQPRAQSAVLEIRDIKLEVQSLGLTYEYKLIEKVKRRSNADDRSRLSLETAAPVLEVLCTHFAANRPFCVEERLINLSAVPDAAEESFEDVAPGPWLLNRVPWSAAEHTIRAVSADAQIATALGIAAGTACLVVERRTWSNGAYVTHVRLIYPGDRHALVANFTPSQPK